MTDPVNHMRGEAVSYLRNIIYPQREYLKKVIDDAQKMLNKSYEDERKSINGLNAIIVKHEEKPPIEFVSYKSDDDPNSPVIWSYSVRNRRNAAFVERRGNDRINYKSGSKWVKHMEDAQMYENSDAKTTVHRLKKEQKIRIEKINANK